MRNATLKQLRMLAAVVRTGSISAAAEALSVTPPAVSMQVKALQDLVGLPLIERAPAGMVPTDAGRRVVDAADRIEAVLADCTATLAGFSGARTGTVAVGVVSTAEYFAPRALAAFAKAHSAIELRLSIGNRADILEGLRRYELDLAVMGRPPQELDVVLELIGDHPHVIVARPDHTLAGDDRVPAAALAKETFLVREPGSGTRGLMERFFAETGVAPRIGMQIGSNETIKQAVMAGLGIAFLSAHTIEAETADGRLAVLRIDGLPIVRQWYAAHLRERFLMPAARAVRDFLTGAGRSFLPRCEAGAPIRTGRTLTASTAPV